MGQAATSALGSAFGGLVAGVIYGGFGATAFFGFAGLLSIAAGLWRVVGPVRSGRRSSPRPRAAGRVRRLD